MVVIYVDVEPGPVYNLCEFPNPRSLSYINKDEPCNFIHPDIFYLFYIKEVECGLFKEISQFFCSQHGCEGIKIRIYVGCDDLHEGMLTYTIRIDKPLTPGSKARGLM